jgi:MFS transporter, ACS family, hexuronate transporter
VAEWFPKKERALVTGIFNAGTNVGATVAPLMVPWLTLNWGWRWAFIVTGAIGFLWLFFWLPIYRRPQEHPRLSKAELEYIESDPPDPEEKIPWSRLLQFRQTWTFALAKFLTDPVWWFYLFWVPGFLKKEHGIDLQEIWLPLIIIYVVADFGSIGGGWLSSAMIKRGWSINRSRKTAMLVCALCVVPIMLMSRIHNVWEAVALIALAAAAHQGWSANVFTMASDMVPRKAIGSVVGIGGMAGAIGGMLVAKATGYLLEWTGSYFSLFVIAGSLYLFALAVVQVLSPKLKPVEF